MVAAQDADHVGTRRLEPALGQRVARVDAKDHVAVLRLRADEELGRMGQGGGGDQRHAQMLGYAAPPRQALASPQALGYK